MAAPIDRGSAQARIDAAPKGSVLQLEPGIYHGPIVIRKALTLRGEGAVLDGDGTSRVVTVDAAHVTLEGLEVRHGGKEIQTPDAGIYLSALATSAVVRNIDIHDVLYGIWIHETNDVRVEGCTINGGFEGFRARRGNGIQLFNANDLKILNNHIIGGRDGIYVSATENSLIAGNRIEGTGYGVHYMYSSSNTVRDNEAYENQSGYAIMASRDITVRNNRAFDNVEHGILLREVLTSTISDNHSFHNESGMFFYLVNQSTISNNHLQGNRMGAKVWAGSGDNRVSGNTFIGNATQMHYVGTFDLIWGIDSKTKEKKGGNNWSDYIGWDQDGDGVGDRPYRVNSFATKLLYQYPPAIFLANSPSLELLNHLEAKMPVLQTATVVDMAPRMQPLAAHVAAENRGGR
jgi:nitrous oxidase accessory protein